MLDLETLMRVPCVDPTNGFDLSPDGSQAAFSWNPSGSWQVYTLALAAGAPEPRPLAGASSSPGASFTPRFSPDGKRLACVVDRDGGENFHLVVHELETGAQHDLTRGVDYALQPNFSWSPDGSQIAFASDQSGTFDAYVMPSSGGAEVRVLSIGHPVWDVRFSPDGAWLAVTFESSGQDYGVQIVSLREGSAFSLSEGGAPLNAHNPCWSPDSRRLAFHGDAPDGFHQIGLFDLASREVDWLTHERADHRSPNWSKDGSRLVYVRARGASDEIVVRPLHGTGRDACYRVAPGVHYKPRFTPDGRELVFVFNDPRRPPDLWKLDLATGHATQLVRSLPPILAQATFPMPQQITYPGLDGTPVPALCYADAAAGPRPAVVVVHGGPNWHYQMEWYPFMTHLASRGWVVLAPNYRGSTGYGREWQYANRLDLGGVDTDDVAAAAEHLANQGLADPDRIAVTGRSHGGYLTMTSLTTYPHLWVAGSGVVPFTNWFTCHARSRGDLQHWDLQMMGDPVQNHDLWRERSPYFHLQHVQAPVQLICGAHDPRCPAEDSIEARDRLRALDKQVEFHLYEDEGHSFLKTENLIRSEAQRVRFLERHLEP